MFSITHKIYYSLKPFIPRSLQIFLRRKIALQKRELTRHVWPIDEKANRPPEGWSGWPEGKKFALVLTHDVDTAKGHERCIQLAMVEESLGFRSSFNFVAEEYQVSEVLRKDLAGRGFEVGVHGIKHSGDPFRSRKIFQEQAIRINEYLKDWKCVGYRSPCMYHNLDWIGELNIDYDASTFETDPFEPQPDGVGTIFPFWVRRNLEPPTSNLEPPTALANGFIELPYTLPQDFTLFILLEERNIDIWKNKLDWLARNGGMALLITHPDYMNFDGKKLEIEEYPARYYEEFLQYIIDNYEGLCWNVLPKDIALFWKENCSNKSR
jgi:peptidoglycan/xylan/chitin deacetylase (PgdA/CDA1 family)